MALSKDNRFYVYEWYNKDTGEVFYVGKGSGNRHKVVNGRNSYFQRYYNKYNCDVRKVKEHLLEQDAYELEIKLIAEYKENCQCFCNFKSGGEGGAVDANVPEDTRLLKLITAYVNNSKKLVGNRDNATFLRLGVRQERPLIFACQEFGVYTSEQFNQLDRNKKIEISRRMEEFVIEEEYNDEVYDLIEDGYCGSFDEYWEHVYKY